MYTQESDKNSKFETIVYIQRACSIKIEKKNIKKIQEQEKKPKPKENPRHDIVKWGTCKGAVDLFSVDHLCARHAV